jgi:flagellin-like protein
MANKKGITPVVALILLLVIVIVIVGFSFGVFQGVVQSAGESAQTQAETTSGQVTQTVRIESIDAATGTVSVRNIGSNNINASTVGVYANGAYVSCIGADWSDQTIAAGSVSTCTDTGIQGCTIIRVTSPSGASETMDC